MSNSVIPINDESPAGNGLTTAQSAAWENLLEGSLESLGPDDHYIIAGTQGRHRRGWVKLRRDLGISIQICHRDQWTDPVTGDWGWDFEVRATLPRGRYEEGDGSASYSELMKSWENNGRKGAEPNRHIVRTRAMTRASNRATQGLLGLPENTPLRKPSHELHMAREAAFENLMSDANAALKKAGLDPYYRDTQHVADSLRLLGYSVYKVELHLDMAQRLANRVIKGNGRSAVKDIAELYGGEVVEQSAELEKSDDPA